MLTYRTHVYGLAAAASAEATRLALSIAECVAGRGDGNYKERVQEVLPTLMGDAESLQQAVDAFLAGLPVEVREHPHGRLFRHMYWIKIRLGQSIPAACAQDAIDIVRDDIPAIMKQFEKWYQQRANVDSDLNQRLTPLIAAGQLNAAAREAWVIFKTRMVDRFELSEELDGQRLVHALFGTDDGATTSLLSNKDKEAILELI